MCLTNIQETQYIGDNDIPRTAYKVTWHGSTGAFTGPFSPERIVRGEWRIPEDGVDHVETSERLGRLDPEQLDEEDRIVMKRNPASDLRLSYNKYGPCYHVFWSQENAAKYVYEFIRDFGYNNIHTITNLRVELVKVRGEIRTGVLARHVPGAGLASATATRILFQSQDNA
jgi:hypothetical protein